MSGNLIVAALYDREGSLWVGTETGIDRFRETKLTPIAPPGYLESAAVAPDSNGTVWVATKRGTPAALLRVGDRIVPRLDAPRALTCIYRDLRGGLWIGGSGLWERKRDMFAPVLLPPVQPGGSPLGREIQAVARERDGGLWVSIAFNEGVFRRRPGRGWERFGAPRLADRSPANVITTDSSGRTWLGYQRGELALVVGDSVRVFAAEEGLDVGRVLAISVYGDRVWIGGQSGVAALDARELGRQGRRLFVPLHPAGEPLRGVSGVVETADGELWLNGADGVTRIPAAEVRRALAEPGYQVRYERLDYRDGIEPPAQQVRPLPSAAAGTDGRIWFASAGGVAWVDPHRVRRNTVPPPVQLRALTAGGRRYFAGKSAGDTLRLPPRALGAQRGVHGLQPGRARPGAIQVPPRGSRCRLAGRRRQARGVLHQSAARPLPVSTSSLPTMTASGTRRAHLWPLPSPRRGTRRGGSSGSSPSHSSLLRPLPRPPGSDAAHAWPPSAPR